MKRLPAIILSVVFATSSALFVSATPSGAADINFGGCQRDAITPSDHAPGVTDNGPGNDARGGALHIPHAFDGAVGCSK